MKKEKNFRNVKYYIYSFAKKKKKKGKRILACFLEEEEG